MSKNPASNAAMNHVTRTPLTSGTGAAMLLGAGLTMLTGDLTDWRTLVAGGVLVVAGVALILWKPKT